MRTKPSSRYEVEIVRTWDAIASRWNDLAALGTVSPFQASPWLENWYAVLGKKPDVEPLFVIVREAEAQRRDMMILPLVRRSADGLKHIEFADLWVTDYNAPLAHPDFDDQATFEENVWPQIIAALPPADFVNFVKMPVVLGERKNPIAVLGTAKLSGVRGHIISLPDTWEGYLATLSKDTRRTLKRRWTKFMERGNTELRRITSEPEALIALNTLQAQQVARLEDRGAKHVFNEPIYRELYRRYAVNGLTNGSVALYALFDGADIVATFLGLTSGHTCTLIRSSQSKDESLKSFSLGRLIMFHALEDLHRQGCRVFDLSIGSHAYKEEFKVNHILLADLSLRLSWRAVPFVAKRRAIETLARHPRLLSIVKSISGKVFPVPAP